MKTMRSQPRRGMTEVPQAMKTIRSQPRRGMTVVPQAMKTMRSQPRRGMTVVASHFRSTLSLATNGTQECWYKGTVEKRAFRYATASNPCRVPTARSLPQPYYQHSCVPLVASDKVERKWLATTVTPLRGWLRTVFIGKHSIHWQVIVGFPAGSQWFLRRKPMVSPQETGGFLLRFHQEPVILTFAFS